jgi:predicted double-glycine peptidase
MRRSIITACVVAAGVLSSTPLFADWKRAPVRSLLETRQAGVVVQKWETSCAAAALATVFTYALETPVTEKYVAQRMLRTTDPIKVKVRGGFSFLDMKRFAEAHGFKGTGYSGLTFEEALALSSPIVPIDFYGNAHFVVLRGLTADGGVDLADPAYGNVVMSEDKFKASWTGGMGFVVTR